jgi:hypothetical protein
MTIATGFGDGLVSALPDRCSITLVLLLTIVATELPEHVKEVPQMNEVKQWAFNFCFGVVLKDAALVNSVSSCFFTFCLYSSLASNHVGMLVWSVC